MITPMECEESEIFNDSSYEWEIKFDGERAILFIANGKVEIQNKRGKDISYRYPELQVISGKVSSPNNNDGRAKRVVDVEFPEKRAVLDGEIVVFDEAGKSDFELLAQRSHLEKRFDIELRAQEFPAVFVAFDILNIEGEDITGKPIIERKKILIAEYKESKVFMVSKFLTGSGPALFEKIKSLNLEGLVAKEKNSPYVERRSPYWKKVKYTKTTDIIVTAYAVNPAGIRVENDTGFGCQVAGQQSRAVKEIIDKQGYAKIEVKFLNRTKANRLRMPTFVKLVEGE